MWLQVALPSTQAQELALPAVTVPLPIMDSAAQMASLCLVDNVYLLLSISQLWTQLKVQMCRLALPTIHHWVPACSATATSKSILPLAPHVFDLHIYHPSYNHNSYLAITLAFLKIS